MVIAIPKGDTRVPNIIWCKGCEEANLYENENNIADLNRLGKVAVIDWCCMLTDIPIGKLPQCPYWLLEER